MECGAKEESEKKIRRKRGRKEGRKTGEICFQTVIPPSLSASNPNVFSGVKSCQSTNGGRQTALFNTELKIYIYMPVFIFYICFLQTNICL